MYDSQGSLALQKNSKHGRRRHLLRPAVQQPAVPLRRIAPTELPISGSQLAAQTLAIRRQLRAQRLKSLSLVIVLVMSISGLFGLIVYRQAMILERNFANLATERTVARIQQKCGQINEELAQKTDLDLIRNLAVERLGLQDPARRQVVTVSIPNSDRIVFANGPIVDDSNEAYLATVFKNIEGFFKTASVTGTGY